MDADADISANATDNENARNAGLCKKLGVCVFLWMPPGSMNVAVKTPAVMSVETSMQLIDVLFVHDSAFVNNSLCSSANISLTLFTSLPITSCNLLYYLNFSLSSIYVKKS